MYKMAAVSRRLLTCQPRWCLRRAMHVSSRCLGQDENEGPSKGRQVTAKDQDRTLKNKNTQITQPVAGDYHDPIEVFRKEFAGKGARVEVPAETDVLIIGGGAIGLATAYWLQRRAISAMTVTVVERDPTYSQASTPLSAGGIRQQFSIPENIQMSKFGAQFIREVKENLTCKEMEPPDIPFTPAGYLLLAGEDGSHVMRENHEVQMENGAHVNLLMPDELKTQFPWLNTEGIALGSLGTRDEGWFDPWSLLLALKVKAASLGVKFIKGEVVDFTCKSDRMMNQEGKMVIRKHLDYAHVHMDDDEIYPVKMAMCVNTAGAWAAEVGKMAGIGEKNMIDTVLNIPIPVEPRKRYVFVVHCPDGPLLDMPMIVDPTGTWVRREGLAGQYLCGISPQQDSEEPEASDLSVDHSWFEDKIWENLANRIPAFENLKVTSSYAGYYDYNFMDHNLIIGNHPYHRNFFMAVGSSGHGIQHAPAIGRAMAELILDDEYTTIDLSRFSFDRILSNELIFEKNII